MICFLRIVFVTLDNLFYLPKILVAWNRFKVLTSVLEFHSFSLEIHLAEPFKESTSSSISSSISCSWSAMKTILEGKNLQAFQTALFSKSLVEWVHPPQASKRKLTWHQVWFACFYGWLIQSREHVTINR